MTRKFGLVILVILIALVLSACAETTPEQVVEVIEELPVGSTFGVATELDGTAVSGSVQWQGVQPTWTPVAGAPVATDVPQLAATDVPQPAANDVPQPAATDVPQPAADCTVLRLQAAMASGGPQSYIATSNQMSAEGCPFKDLADGEQFQCTQPICLIVGEYDVDVAGVDHIEGSVPSAYGHWPGAVLHDTWTVTGLKPGLRVMYDLVPTE